MSLLFFFVFFKNEMKESQSPRYVFLNQSHYMRVPYTPVSYFSFRYTVRGTASVA